MDQKRKWLGISFWTGAVVDGLAGLYMLVIAVFATSIGLTSSQPGSGYRFAMGFGAALMLGWTGVLIWAAQKPLERKGILLIVIPAIFGLIGSEIGAVTLHFMPLKEMIPIGILQLALILLFSYSYWKAK